MSRIGKKPIELPDKVSIKVADGRIVAEGPKGRLVKPLPPKVAIDVQDKEVVVGRDGDDRHSRAYHGLTRAIIANMVAGVSKGFERQLIINGVGYRVEQEGNKLVFSLGHSHQKSFELPETVSAQIEDRNTRLILTGVDNELLGQCASKIRGFRPPEPYKLKGIRYAEEQIKQKEGKKGA